MTVIAATIVPAVHTGQCRVPRGRASTRQEQGYCVHDPSGQPVGTIKATVQRPILGPNAPTFYLRRD
jgi:hypothetical protein